MKFRASMQIPRDGGNSDRPATATPWKLSNLKDRHAKTPGLDRSRSVAERPPKSAQEHAFPSTPATTNAEAQKPLNVDSEATAQDTSTRRNESQPKLPNRRNTVQDFMSKTGAQLRTSLRARGTRLSEGLRGQKKSKVVCTDHVYGDHISADARS